MSDRDLFSWIDEPLKILHLEKSQPLKQLPHKECWIIDNWLPDSIFQSWIDWRSQSVNWGLSNRVIRDGEKQHLYWGESFYTSLREIKAYHGGDKLRIQPLSKRRWSNVSPDWRKTVINTNESGYCHPLVDNIIWRLQQEFRFDWVRFQYCGMNGQITGQDGTLHEDTHKGEDGINNLTFLFYDQPYWEDDWGGDLIFYDSRCHDEQFGKGILEHEEEYEIGRVQYKPNRLVVVNGMITHRHPGPTAPYEKPHFPFRTSLVCRGDEIKLWDKGVYKHKEYEY